MSNLRQRNWPTASKSHPKGTQLTNDTTPSNSSTASVVFKILLALLSFGVSVFLWTYVRGPSACVDCFAVCSRPGARIYTVDDFNPTVQCLVVQDKLIVDTGSLDDVSARWTAAYPSGPAFPIRYIDDRSIVVPGLSDAHMLAYGAKKELALDGARSIDEIIALVRAHVVERPDVHHNSSKYIEGWGWDHTSWPVQEWPTAGAFEEDPVLHGRPIVLQSKDGHALWVSKRVLELSGPFPEDVEGGIVVRDALGNPTGVFLDNAHQFVKRAMQTEDDLYRHFTTAAMDALSLGLMSIHDTDLQPLSIIFLKRQAAEGLLPSMECVASMRSTSTGEMFRNKPLINVGNGLLSVRSVKIFADGALRSGGAALFEPYHDNSGTKGFMRFDEQVLREVVPRFLKDGWQVNIHAIGDYANSVVLDAFEAPLRDVNVTALRPRLEHAQILRMEDMARVGRLNACNLHMRMSLAGIWQQVIHSSYSISDTWFAEDRLGPERVKGLYAFRSLHDHGARLAFGSDFPVEDMNPLTGFYAAITRLSPEGDSPHGPSGWFPEQRLSRQQTLRGMAIETAHASFTEDTLGSIVPGKRADFVVLSQDVMTVPMDRILETRVRATFVDGRCVYEGLLEATEGIDE